MLVKEVFALLLIQIKTNFRLDIVFQFQLLQLYVHETQSRQCSFFQVINHQQILLFFHRKIHIRRNKIDQERLAFNIFYSKGSFRWNVRAFFYNLNCQFFYRINNRRKFRFIVIWTFFRNFFDGCFQVRLF
ncbi:hypothetical protein D3C86_1247690 [compost metagenome]